MVCGSISFWARAGTIEGSGRLVGTSHSHNLTVVAKNDTQPQPRECGAFLEHSSAPGPVCAQIFKNQRNDRDLGSWVSEIHCGMYPHLVRCVTHHGHPFIHPPTHFLLQRSATKRFVYRLCRSMGSAAANYLAIATTNLHSPSRMYTRSPLLLTVLLYLQFFIRIRAHITLTTTGWLSPVSSQRPLCELTKSRWSGIRVDVARYVARLECG